MDDLESTVMELIIQAGASKSYAMEALRAAKIGHWNEVDTHLENSRLAAKSAHDIQTNLIGMDEGCGKVPVNLIMVHAQDHIMTAMLAKEMIQELIELHRQLQANQTMEANHATIS